MNIEFKSIESARTVDIRTGNVLSRCIFANYADVRIPECKTLQDCPAIRINGQWYHRVDGGHAEHLQGQFDSGRI